MENKQFTLEKALGIQAEQMATWKIKLNAACYCDLQTYVNEMNARLTESSDPHQVTRGSDLSQFIQRWPDNNIY